MSTIHESLPISTSPITVRKFIGHTAGDHIHWHEQIEILYFTEGEGVLPCNLREHTVKAGDIVLINGKELHAGCIRGQTVYYCIQVNTDFFHNLIGEEYVVFDNIITSREAAALLDEVIVEAQKSGYEILIAIKRIMYEFFALIGKSHTRSVLTKEDYKKQFKRLDTFNSVIEYIDQHFDEDLNVQGLASLFYISPSYFAHTFKKRSGKGVTEYINELRISHAKSFLEKGDRSIGEIALRVGFNDINYFSRRFKAIEGVTPTEYKKSCEERKK